MKRVLNVMVALVAAVLAAEAAAQPLFDLLNKKRNVELVAKGGRFLEGPVFDREGNLWVVEVGGGYLSRVEGDKVVRVVQFAPDSAPQGAALHQDGRIFVTDRNLGVWSYDPKSRQAAQVVRYFHGQSFKGPNDLTFDSKGNLWFTDAWGTGVDNPTGALYMAEAAGGYKQIRKIIGNLAMPNGVQFNADESILYIAELRKNRSWRCQMDKEQGGIGTCAVFTNFMSGIGPDGLKLDEKGNVYQAHFLSGGVYVASPVNDVLEFIRVPSGRCTTNLAFRPGTKWLYITEACENAVWRVEVDNPGMTLWGLR